MIDFKTFKENLSEATDLPVKGRMPKGVSKEDVEEKIEELRSDTKANDLVSEAVSLGKKVATQEYSFNEYMEALDNIKNRDSEFGQILFSVAGGEETLPLMDFATEGPNLTFAIKRGNISIEGGNQSAVIEKQTINEIGGIEKVLAWLVLFKEAKV